MGYSQINLFFTPLFNLNDTRSPAIDGIASLHKRFGYVLNYHAKIKNQDHKNILTSYWNNRYNPISEIPGKDFKNVLSLTTACLYLGDKYDYMNPKYTLENVIKKYLSESVNIVYSMFETNAIHPKWVEIINNYYTYLYVPDKYLVDVYRNSGVTIPIFNVPIPSIMSFKEAKGILFGNEKPIPYKNPDKFRILTIASGTRKNIYSLILSFQKAFPKKKFPNHELFIHDKFSNYLRDKNIPIAAKEDSRIKLGNKCLTNGELDMLYRSSDIYFSMSYGEGFALPPREALLRAIPTVLSYTTAHKTIVDEEGAIGVDLTGKLIDADYSCINLGNVGQFEEPSIADAALKLKMIYKNYKEYKDKAIVDAEIQLKYLYTEIEEKYGKYFDLKYIKERGLK